ncbi:RluA family pseudouridine synthase [bacterium]|nr:MAG: RluA family pseudouridine synthase [bacterium]
MPMDYNFVVTEEESGKRLDIYLSEKIKGCSRTLIQRLIFNKEVLVSHAFPDESKALCPKSHYKVNPGDAIHFVINESKPALLVPQDIPLKIIYEDDCILVIDKPSGLTVHPGAGSRSGTLVNALLSYTKNLSTVNPERPGIVHRLDKETSGLMVIARNNAAHLNLAKQFSAHTVKKKYVALVNGRVEFDEGVIDLPIGRHKGDFRRQAVSFVDSRPAFTGYKVLKRFDDATFLELAPQTGRTHQLRVHLAHIGHPILGDSKYGRPSDFGRLALHAMELGFRHPESGVFVSFTSELPKEFIGALK